MALAPPEQALALPSSPARKRPAVDDAGDMQLDRALVNVDDQPLECAPPWALALQANISNKLDRVLLQNDELGERVGHLEIKASEDRERIRTLEEQLKGLQKSVEGQSKPASSRSEESGSPFEARAGVNIPPPSSLRDEADFNHIIVGGWPTDSRKQLIEQDMQALVDSFECFQTAGVSRLAVFGKRARVGHIFLRPMLDHQARARFFELLPVVNKKRQATGGDLIWISPSKPFAVRERNKLLRNGYDRLIKATGCNAESEDLELDWNMGVAWIQGSRVIALGQDALLVDAQRVTGVKFSAGLKVPGVCFYCLDNIVRVTGRTLADLEASLRTE